MVDLSTCDSDELKNRLRYLLNDLDKKYKEIGPTIEKIGRIREEIEIISIELNKREREE